MKTTEEMQHHEVVFELARHAHPSHYHAVIDTFPTRALKALLAYYRTQKDAPEAGRPRHHE